MTFRDIGSIGEAVGAIATVITLLYLALQIKANTLASKRQTLDDVIERMIRWEARLVESPDLIRSWIDGHRSFNGLSPEDQLRFTALIFEILAVFEPTFEAAKFGHIKAETIGAVKALTAQLGRSDGIREWWEANGQMTFAADFVSEVNRIFLEARTTPQDVPGPFPFRIPTASHNDTKCT